jgi:hypothetical protein
MIAVPSCYCNNPPAATKPDLLDTRGVPTCGWEMNVRIETFTRSLHRRRGLHSDNGEVQIAMLTTVSECDGISLNRSTLTNTPKKWR